MNIKNNLLYSKKRRVPNTDESIIDALKNAAKKNIASPVIHTDKRGVVILDIFIGARFEIHNGKSFESRVITNNMVGCKLGEFSPTRKYTRNRGNVK